MRICARRSWHIKRSRCVRPSIIRWWCVCLRLAVGPKLLQWLQWIDTQAKPLQTHWLHLVFVTLARVCFSRELAHVINVIWGGPFCWLVRKYSNNASIQAFVYSKQLYTYHVWIANGATRNVPQNIAGWRASTNKGRAQSRGVHSLLCA